MTETTGTAGPRLRLARQARGFSQQQLAGMTGVSRQAVSAVEAGHSDPSLRVAFALAQALGMTVEELFGPADLAPPVAAVPVAPPEEPGGRVLLAQVGDRFVALPLRGDAAAGMGFVAAGGQAVLPATALPAREAAGPAAGRAAATIAVRPIGPPRPTLVVAGCDPALPLLAPPLALLDPPVAFAWWPCGSLEALRLAASGLVHAAGVHLRDADGGYNATAASHLPGGAEVVGFTAWREGLVLRPELAPVITGVDSLVKDRRRVVNREAGAEAGGCSTGSWAGWAPTGPNSPATTPGPPATSRWRAQSRRASPTPASRASPWRGRTAWISCRWRTSGSTWCCRGPTSARGRFRACSRCSRRRGCSPSWPACPAMTWPPAATGSGSRDESQTRTIP